MRKNIKPETMPWFTAALAERLWRECVKRGGIHPDVCSALVKAARDLHKAGGAAAVPEVEPIDAAVEPIAADPEPEVYATPPARDDPPATPPTTPRFKRSINNRSAEYWARESPTRHSRLKKDAVKENRKQCNAGENARCAWPGLQKKIQKQSADTQKFWRRFAKL